MKSEISAGSNYEVYYWYNKCHRVNGPAYIVYETIEKKRRKFIRYYLYDKDFWPWWVNDVPKFVL